MMVFYYKVYALKSDGKATDTIYVRGIRELYDSDVLWFLNSIYTEKAYCQVHLELLDESDGEQTNCIEDVFLGANFYSVKYRSMLGNKQTICISMDSFPSPDAIMRYNKYLGKYHGIEEIYAIEKVSKGMVSIKYAKWRDYYKSKASAVQTNVNFEVEEERLWNFPEGWINPTK